MKTAAPAPGVFGCLLLLAAVDVSARLIGLRGTLSWVRRLARPAGAPVDAQACARAVSVAAAFYPRRARCLEQSLALFLLLRRGGAAAELRIGVQPRPFYAHAWVEVDGTPLRESRDLAQTFATFATLEV